MHSGARFSKAQVINGPVKLLLFTCKIEVSVGFISNMIKLSVSKIKWSSLLARGRFSKVPINNGPGKPSSFILKIEVSQVLHLA